MITYSFSDDYVKNKYLSETFWVVTLSNGETAVQDDDKPSFMENSGWKRLKVYCETHNLYVVDFFLKFRSNIVKNIIDDYTEGVFFTKGLRANMVLKTPTPQSLYVAGFVKDNKIYVKKYSTPELQFVRDEVYDIGPLKEPLIIWRDRFGKQRGNLVGLRPEENNICSIPV